MILLNYFWTKQYYWQIQVAKWNINYFFQWIFSNAVLCWCEPSIRDVGIFFGCLTPPSPKWQFLNNFWTFPTSTLSTSFMDGPVCKKRKHILKRNLLFLYFLLQDNHGQIWNYYVKVIKQEKCKCLWDLEKRYRVYYGKNKRTHRLFLCIVSILFGSVHKLCRLSRGGSKIADFTM